MDKDQSVEARLFVEEDCSGFLLGKEDFVELMVEENIVNK